MDILGTVYIWVYDIPKQEVTLQRRWQETDEAYKKRLHDTTEMYRGQYIRGLRRKIAEVTGRGPELRFRDDTAVFALMIGSETFFKDYKKQHYRFFDFKQWGSFTFPLYPFDMSRRKIAKLKGLEGCVGYDTQTIEYYH